MEEGEVVHRTGNAVKDKHKEVAALLLYNRITSFFGTTILILLVQFAVKRFMEQSKEVKKGSLFPLRLVEKHGWKTTKFADLPAVPPPELKCVFCHRSAETKVAPAAYGV